MAKWPYSTRTWQRLRKRKLADASLCQDCLERGRHVIAEQVDHVVSIANGGEPFPSLDGLRSLCPMHHSQKTNRLDNPHSYGFGRPIKGCDVDGNPLDPDDLWNTGGADHRCKEGGADRRGIDEQTYFQRMVK